MKKFLVVAVLVAGLVGMAMVASAATNITNWCTSTYELTGSSVTASGNDSAVVAMQTVPNILVAKLAKNLRTGQEDAESVNAVSGDTILFTIIWSNAGEATADEIVLKDYIPAGLTYVAASVSDTEVDATGSAVEASDVITYTGNSVDGTDDTASDGIVKFQAMVD